MNRWMILTLAGCAMTATAAHATVVPFTEDFATGAANWYDMDGAAPAAWVASGGADGGGYLTASYTVPAPPPMFGSILFRGQDEFGASGGAFEGDWIADGATLFSFWVRHDAPGPLPFGARFAGPANFPGAVGLSMPVMPGEWTEVQIDISPSNPSIILEGAPFEDVFSNVGHVQILALADATYAGLDITVDLDLVSVTPTPGASVVLLMGILAPRCRRRR